MTRDYLAFHLALVAAFACAGCGDEGDTTDPTTTDGGGDAAVETDGGVDEVDGGPDGGMDGSTPPTNYPVYVPTTVAGTVGAGYVAARCASLEAGCRSVESELVDRLVFATPGAPDCATIVATVVGSEDRQVGNYDPLDTIGRNVLAGFVGEQGDRDFAIDATWTLDEALMRECFTTIRDRCLPFHEGPLLVTACREMLSGSVARGAACDSDFDCAGDAFCGPEVQGDGSCTRSVCVARGDVGEVCAPEESSCTAGDAIGRADCVEGPEGGPATCALTEVSSNVALGQPCAETAVCAAGLVCVDATSSGTPTCSTPFAIGADCRVQGHNNVPVCTAGATCGYDGTTDSFACVTEAYVGLGAACSVDDEPGKACDPFRRLRCDPGADTCVTIGDGSEGARCRTGLTGFDCDDGLRCADDDADDDDVGVCERIAFVPAAGGQGCNVAVDWVSSCVDGYRCRGGRSEATCVPFPLALDESCFVDDDDFDSDVLCGAGLVCRPNPEGEERCLAPGADGADCREDDDCVTGLCNQDRTCGLLPNGAYCSEADECASNACDHPPNEFFTICTEYGTAGDPCSLEWGRACDETSFCDASSGVGTCVARAAAGAPCDPGSSVPTCTSGNHCGYDASSFDYRCVPDYGVGTMCNAWNQCGEGRCSRLPPSQTMVCAAAPLADGWLCGTDDDCDSGICKMDASIGTSRCSQPGEDGTPCDRREECVSGRCGSLDAGGSYVCVPLLTLGDPCSEHVECASGRCASSAICAEPAPNGSPCHEDTECATGTCTEYGSDDDFERRCGTWAALCFDP